MKRIIFCFSIAALMLAASCKKDSGELSPNTWTVAGKQYNATTTKTSVVGNFVSGSDGLGSSIDFVFKNLPSEGGDFKVNNAAYENTDVSITTILGGNVVYKSFADNNTFATLRIIDGKYTMIANNIKVAKIGGTPDTVLVSAFLEAQ